jgi:signal transduction histidine kinase
MNGNAATPAAPGTRLAAEPATRGAAAWPRGVAAWLLSWLNTGLLLGLPLGAGGAVHAVFDSTRGFVWGFGLGLLLTPAVSVILRPLVNHTRRLAGHWSGAPVPVPYLPPPRRTAGGRKTWPWRWLCWLLRDPATWRDLSWVVTSTAVSWVLPLASWACPRLLHRYGQLARALLGPAGRATMTLRIRHLAQTRADTIDAGAAELRRIERDLHDGAQARLVAMGMTLDAMGQLLAEDPAAAQALLAEARQSSAQALAELRDLVRGIHPPVLADRGLAEAVRALALDLPLRVHFASELDGRPPAAVESAAYFAVSELLANVSKHACAAQAWVDLRHDGGMLRVSVADDGAGGADPAAGSGLAGLERRLAAFDGLLAVSSPPGGPTVVNMEIPCALSSPKTSFC